MKQVKLGVLLAFAVCLLAQPVWAGASTEVQDEAEDRRTACEEASEALWERSTQEQMEGNARYATCLEAIIKDLDKRYYPPNAFGDDVLESKLSAIKEPLVDLYWGLYQGMESCHGSCGTMYNVVPSAKYNHFLERLLKDMAEFIDEQNPNP